MWKCGSGAGYGDWWRCRWQLRLEWQLREWKEWGREKRRIKVQKSGRRWGVDEVSQQEVEVRRSCVTHFTPLYPLLFLLPLRLKQLHGWRRRRRRRRTTTDNHYLLLLLPYSGRASAQWLLLKRVPWWLQSPNGEMKWRMKWMRRRRKGGRGEGGGGLRFFLASISSRSRPPSPYLLILRDSSIHVVVVVVVCFVCSWLYSTNYRGLRWRAKREGLEENYGVKREKKRGRERERALEGLWMKRTVLYLLFWSFSFPSSWGSRACPHLLMVSYHPSWCSRNVWHLPRPHICHITYADDDDGDGYGLPVSLLSFFLTFISFSCF